MYLGLGLKPTAFKCREKKPLSSHALQIGSGADLTVPSLGKSAAEAEDRVQYARSWKRRKGELLTCIVSRVLHT